jgi:collagenase-like PrtC family protease
MAFRLTLLWCILGILRLNVATVSAALASNANLPPAQQQHQAVNRRKSPALWRNDLVQHDVTTSTIPLRKPQVMAPAGGWPQLQAAVANGADAVYLGLSTFSARARAANFDAEQLPKAVSYCHDHDVKVYVALNTLVFDKELEQVEHLVRLCSRAQVDALIVQDLGVAKLAHRVAPLLDVHASTQQSVTSADGVAFCRDYSRATRVVVGRELSVDEIAQCHHHQGSAELEAFVHGALCVSYSGQCFSSEAWGGRSANRGQCAQACRLPYGLIVNGELKDLQDMTYLLSPQDLCGVEMVPKLIQAGVSCLKIEGRLKDEFYVAATTRAYRNAVDQAWAELTNETSSQSKVLSTDEQVTKQELQQLFSRGQDEDFGGLTAAFLAGTQHQTVVRGRSPRHRGVHVGRVMEGSSPKNGLLVSDLNIDDLKLGDGLVVDRGLAQLEELGGPIFDIEELQSGVVRIRFGREVEKRWKRADENARKGIGGSSKSLAPAGAHVWRTSDATVDKKMRRLSQAEPPRKMAQVSVKGSVGEPLVVTIVSGNNVASGSTDDVLQEATGSGLDPAKVRKAIGTLGNSKWTIQGEVDVAELSGDAWCPMSWIKEARRRAIDNLENHNAENEHYRRKEAEFTEGVAHRLLTKDSRFSSETDDASIATRLSVLARNYEQVDAICGMAERGEAIDEIIADFLEVDGMRDAVARIRKAGVRSVVASPRIIKPGESGIWRTLLRLEPDGLLIRSAGLLYRMNQLGKSGDPVNVGSGNEKHFVKIPELIGDFSLNAANALTAMELLDTGLARITASYDLNANGISTMATTMGKARAQHLEVVAHLKMPVFHTEHCVFARFLSKGNSYLDCGHVCTRNNVHLRDEGGNDNLVLADMGCRNTVFSAQSQSGVQSIRQWIDAGIHHFRVELVDEGAEDTETIVSGYLGVLAGTAKPSVVWDSLRYTRDSNGRAAGVSLGSFRNSEERKAGAL